MKLLRSVGYAVNILLAVLFLFSSLSIFIDPQKFWIPALLGLLFPLLFLLNLFFVLLWMISSRRKMLLSLIVLLISFPVSKSYFSLHTSSQQEKKNTGDSLRIMSYNVRSFNLYNWNHDENSLQEIVDFARQQHPDVLCLQEFYDADSGKFQTIELLKQKTELNNFFFQKTYEKKNGEAWGIAIFSRYPIVSQAQVAFDHKTSNSCCYVDIDKSGKSFRIFNIHLQSVYLSAQDYRFMQDVEQDQFTRENRVLPILSKLKQAFYFRSEQAKEIAAVIQQSPYPVIVCGDLNDSPASFSYHTLSTGLKDAFLEKGFGIGATYNAFLPFYRIDYILLDPRLNVSQFKTYAINFSDHYPVCAVIAFNQASS